GVCRSPGKADSLICQCSYTSWRLKISSFSRHGHLEQPRQQTRRIATPAVTINASRLPLVTSQCRRLFINLNTGARTDNLDADSLTAGGCPKESEVASVYHRLFSPDHYLSY